MPNLRYRSSQLEMLDMPIADKRKLRQNLKEISLINKLLGGDKTTVSGLKMLMNDTQRKYRIVDIGCGDGGLLRRIWHWANHCGFDVEIMGIDIDPYAIQAAREKSRGYENIVYKVTGYEDYFKTLEQKPDIFISALFCHHLDDQKLSDFLYQMMDNCKIGFVINDLHRHYLAYYGILLLTAIFSRSELTKNDAPLSVAKGFKKRELKNFLKRFPPESFEIKWQWAFRYLAIARKTMDDWP